MLLIIEFGSSVHLAEMSHGEDWGKMLEKQQPWCNDFLLCQLKESFTF
jgi:hypothetical protein